MAARNEETTNHASSIDGRTFQARELEVVVLPGDLVVLRADGMHALGQLLSRRMDGGASVGAGAILGTLDNDGQVVPGAVSPFANGSIHEATRDIWEAVESSWAADMWVGSSRAGRALLRSSAFNRHTFLCGQSGSGKSYALGVLIEQLLIDTDLPILILDPNADFVGLGSSLAGIDSADLGRLESADVRVFGPVEVAGQQLARVRFTALSNEAKAAVLQLDPLGDRAEYNLLLRLHRLMQTKEPDEVVRDLQRSDGADERSLAQRIENLGVLEWEVWAGKDKSVLEVLEPMPRATVINLGGFEQPRERLVVSLALLDHLWARRERRQPILLVIDEAHNVCESHPSDPLAQATTSRLVQIANEGRKYGIWLLLCTQRPSRVHESVLAQCDNLALMRLNSPGDLSEIERLFGFVPQEMLRASPGFRQGESLMAGAFAPAPTFVQMRPRRTREGGGDVQVPRRPDD